MSPPPWVPLMLSASHDEMGNGRWGVELARLVLQVRRMTAILSLLLVVFVSMIITRIATIALAATGLSRESARFQARSALTGAGFTTTESESVVRHPVRRRIVMWLMLIGSAGIAAVIGSIVLAFVQPGQDGSGWLRLLVLAIGLTALWMLASSPWVDRAMTKATMRALTRYTSIDVRDYAHVLHLGRDYLISEFLVPQGHWLAERSLNELALRKEGVIVLGVARRDGPYLGVPKGTPSFARETPWSSTRGPESSRSWTGEGEMPPVMRPTAPRLGARRARPLVNGSRTPDRG